MINCNIYDNIIEDNHYGIHVHYSNYCTITGNIINNNYYMGLSLGRSVYPQISDNIITNTSWFGIYFNFIPDSFVCEMNHIERNKYAGIYLVRSNSSIITKNNFIGNKHNAMILDCSNTWTGNYWDRPRILPKLIFGRKGPFDRFPSMIDFDWHPAKEPYDILLMEL